MLFRSKNPNLRHSSQALFSWNETQFLTTSYDLWLVLKNAKFRLLWLVILLDQVGVVCYFTVSGWLVLIITDSPFWVGATVGMSGLALVLGSLMAGVIVDRADKR